MGLGRSERGFNEPPPQVDLWTVIGGRETDGIVVREGPSLKAKELPQRLSTGALVSALAVRGHCLHFSRISGAGPDRGWVNARFHGEDLVTRLVVVGAPQKEPQKSGDLMESLMEQAKKVIEQCPPEPAQFKGTQELTKEAALAMLEVMMMAMALPSSQERLWEAWEAAAGKAQKQESERRRVILEITGPWLKRTGFASTWDGHNRASAAYVRALGEQLYTNDELKKQILSKWVQSPAYQKIVSWEVSEVQDMIESVRDPQGCFADGRVGGLVGHWQISAGGHIEIVPVDSKLRIVFITEGLTSRGDLHQDDLWHTTVLNSGIHLRLRREVALRICLSTYDDSGWSKETVAELLDDHELATCYALQPWVVASVRELAKDWSVASGGPPQDLGEGLPHPLSQLACSASILRQPLLDMCIDRVTRHLPSAQSQLIYASVGSSDLWLDWWLLESLLAQGHSIAAAHFIHALYTDASVRNSSMNASPLGDMAVWLRACGTRSFAHESHRTFLRQVPRGAHVLLHCNATISFDEVSRLVRSDGGLIFHSDPHGKHTSSQREDDEVDSLDE